MNSTTRLTVDLMPVDVKRLERLVDRLEAQSKADAVRRAIRRCHMLTELGENPSPDAVKLAIAL